MIELRDYQSAAIAELDALWPTHRATILEICTGGGKTATTAAWLHGIFGRHPNTVGGWMVHTGHLREQAGAELDEAGVPWVDWSTVDPHKRRWEPGRVHCFGSTMTLPPGPHQTETVLIVDECHRSASPTYAKEIDRRRGQARRHRRWRRVLGLSGTPARYGWPVVISDSQRKFAGQWDAMVRGPSPAQLVEAGHLADVVVKSIDSAGGDWEVLRPDAMRTSGFTAASERQWERTLSVDAAVAIVTGMEPRPTLWFCASVPAAKQVQKLLGRSSATILADTPRDARRKLIDAFCAGEIDHLVTVRALLEGTDVPVASRIVLLAPSSSRVLLAQAAGRGMRPPGDMEFLDFSRSWEHLGAHPLDDVPWHLSLDITATAEEVEAATSRAWTCPTPGCGTVVSPRTQRLCPTCHFEVVRRCVACWLPMTLATEDCTHRRHRECASIERTLHTKWARDHGVEPVSDLDITADVGGSAALEIGRGALEHILEAAATLERQVGQR